MDLFRMNYMNETQSSESSSVLEALPWEKKAEMSDRSDGLITFAFGNMEKYNDLSEVQVLSSTSPFQEATPLVKKDYSVPFSKMHIRRKKTQEEMAFNRECKKFELAWTNRDLPIDRQSLAASKDAFNLRDLSESLPSSTSKKMRAMKMIRQQRPESYSSQQLQKERFEASMKVSPFSSKTERLHLSDRSPESESVASVQSRRDRCAMNEGSVKLSLLRAKKLHHLERLYTQILAGLDKEPSSNKQSETSHERRNLDMGKTIQNWESFGFVFTEKSDCKQEEVKQDSGVQNNQKGTEITPMPKLNQDMVQCFSWDSEKTWTTDFKFLGGHVPLNSPNEGNANKDDPFLSKQKMLETTSQCCVRSSVRGDVSESMDESESEMPSAKQASGASTPNQLNFREETDNLCTRQNEKGERDMKEAVKNFRSFQSHFSLGSAKSD